MLLILTSTVLLAACTSDAVYLRDPKTGTTAQCGPYQRFFTANGENVVIREQKCISAYEQDGYQKIDNPMKR
jgi:hypothetical protein